MPRSLRALALLAAGCVAPDPEPLAPAAVAEEAAPPPGGEDAATKEGEPAPPDEPRANASLGPRTLMLADVIEVEASAGAGGTPVAGRAKNAVLAIPEEGALALAGDHVVTAFPATGAMARQTVIIEVVLTYA